MDLNKGTGLHRSIKLLICRHMRYIEDLVCLPKVPVRTIFSKDIAFPSADDLTDEMISARLEGIFNRLESHGVFLDLCEGVSDRATYDYFVRNVLDEEILTPDAPVFYDQIIDGCHGDCEGCFQKTFCSIPEMEFEGECFTGP